MTLWKLRDLCGYESNATMQNITPNSLLQKTLEA